MTGFDREARKNAKGYAHLLYPQAEKRALY